ncbi:hypothetical protein J1C17_001437 [Escherichia fergusonii]|nr:hypothetical protein [Escherichia fergusonii]
MGMGYYDLYGYSGVEIYDAQKMLEELIKITFKEKESIYYGGIYLLSGDKRHEHFLLKENYDVLDAVVDEVDYPEYTYLLYINDTIRHDELKNKILSLEGFVLLRSEVNTF